jgi:leader peptidase (prepilin peptidase)/N-methyltransferase
VPVAFMAAAAFILGAVVGSFLNVVIYRLPLGLSLVRPGSRCPSCGAAIRPWQNIPILSYIVLLGRCGNCRARISLRYPLVEALTGALSLGAWLKFGPTPAFGVYFIFLAGLVAVTFIDLDHKIIPDSMSLGGIPLGFAASFVTGVGWQDSLIGIALGGGSLLSVALAYQFFTKREGMGMGDVKLLGAIGAFLGWKSILFTILVSSIAGAVVGLLAMKLQRADRHLEVPFGPFLALGAVVYLFYGPQLIHWYFNLLA